MSSPHTILQNPLAISSLLNIISPPSSGADAIASMMRGRTVPIWLMAASGAIFFVASFTDGKLYPATVRAKEG